MTIVANSLSFERRCFRHFLDGGNTLPSVYALYASPTDNATSPPPCIGIKMEPLNAAENPPTSKSKADNPDNLDVLDYIQDEYRQYALQEISHNHAISYFLPLVHELFSGSESKTKVVFTILHNLMLRL